MHLVGKTIVLTGANHHIGRYLSKFLEGLGAELITIGSEKESSLLADITESASVSTICSELREKEIDVLINLDELFYFGYLSDQASEDLNNMVTANITTPIQLVQAVIPKMLEKEKGLIINVGPVFGIRSLSYFSAYVSTKIALKAFSTELEREHRGSGISIAHISPKNVDYPSNEIDRLYEKIDIIADPNEVVAATIRDSVVNYFYSKNAKFPYNVVAQLKKCTDFIVGRLQAENHYIATQIIKGREFRQSTKKII